MPDYMVTYSGTEVDPLNPDVESIRLEDIAHALSLLCRGGGHLKFFYSVGQHSVNCAAEAEARGLDKKTVLACLLHDASEAYLSDIIRPVKKHLSQYLAIEQKLQDAIWEKFSLNLSQPDLEAVAQIDDIVLYNEITLLMNTAKKLDAPLLQGKCDFSLRQCRDIEQSFVRLANQYLDC